MSYRNCPGKCMLLSQSAPSPPSPAPNLVVKLDLQDQLRVLFPPPHFYQPSVPQSKPPPRVWIALSSQTRTKRSNHGGAGLVGRTTATRAGTDGLASAPPQRSCLPEGTRRPNAPVWRFNKGSGSLGPRGFSWTRESRSCFARKRIKSSLSCPASGAADSVLVSTRDL